MSFFLELMDRPAIPAVVRRAASLLEDGGRLVLVALARHIERRSVRIYEWAHRVFPNAVDCRPIYPAETVRVACPSVIKVTRVIECSMWGLPVEIVTATKITATDGMPDAASLTSQGSPSDARGSFDAPSSATTSTFANGAGGDLVVDATTGLVRPLVSRSQWQTDDASPVCLGKVHRGDQHPVKFGAFTRRHHCRMCGQVRCDKCTQHRRLVVGYERDGPVRVCRDCVARINRGTAK
uniref:FYVE-type domain-containing protein n=1 Tax=Neobodo designis TaxID=312471 RepID=A0A7S1M0K0_NEODS|mmetsp:Transcript_32005/g.99156  ORF Transcript_32005/g.99156 Transcript_32005/m.99156 type:complete len:238 (+) Transcript_32005:508-1221(+)